MITCPWCGTHYLAFQPNCKNCGGPIAAPAGEAPVAEALPGEQQRRAARPQAALLEAPPPAPRSILDQYTGRQMLTDGVAIASGVFALIGGIFLVLGIGLSLFVVTALVGIPFALLGMIFLGLGAAGLVWRYQEARKLVNVLRWGEPVIGQVVEVRQNYSVRVNRRHPWTIRYQFQLNGQRYEGKVKTLNTPGPHLQLGCSTYVLYLRETPTLNALYPHP